MSAPVSQMSAAALPAGTEQLALVAALCQGSHDARASRFGMASVLFKHQREVLSNELRARDATLARGVGEEPIVLGVKSNGGRLLACECHGSNMTPQDRGVKPEKMPNGTINALSNASSPPTTEPRRLCRRAHLMAWTPPGSAANDGRIRVNQEEQSHACHDDCG